MTRVSLEDLRSVSYYTFADAVVRRLPGRLLRWSMCNIVVFCVIVLLMTGHDARNFGDTFSLLVKGFWGDLKYRILDLEHLSGTHDIQLAVFWAAMMGTVVCGLIAIVTLLRVLIQRRNDPHAGLQRFRAIAGLVSAQTILLVMAAALGLLFTGHIMIPIPQLAILFVLVYAGFAIRVVSTVFIQTPLTSMLASPPPEEATREAKTIIKDIMTADVDGDDTCIAIRIAGAEWRARLTPLYACCVSRTHPTPLFVTRDEIKIEVLGRDALSWGRKSVRVHIGLEDGPSYAGVKGRGLIAQKSMERLERWKSEMTSMEQVDGSATR